MIDTRYFCDMKRFVGYSFNEEEMKKSFLDIANEDIFPMQQNMWTTVLTLRKYSFLEIQVYLSDIKVSVGYSSIFP